jgi:hypothetical protein
MHQVVDVVWHGWIMLDSFLRPETTTFIWVPAESEHRRGVGRKHFEPGWGPQSHRRIMAGIVMASFTFLICTSVDFFLVVWAGWHFLSRMSWKCHGADRGLVWSTQVCVWRWSTALRLQRAISCRRVTSLLGGGCQIVQAREPEIPLSQALGDPGSFFRPFRVQDLTWDAAKALPRMVHWGFTHVYTILCGNPQKR